MKVAVVHHDAVLHRDANGNYVDIVDGLPTMNSISVAVDLQTAPPARLGLGSGAPQKLTGVSCAPREEWQTLWADVAALIPAGPLG